MKPAALSVCLVLSSHALGQDIVEPRSGVAFAAKVGEMSAVGVGVRTRTLFKVKVYAIGLYVADSALAGLLAAREGSVGTPAFYRELLSGDLEKRIVLKFLRDVSADQVRGAFRQSLEGAEGAKIDLFVGYFGDTKVGQEYVLRWAPGGILETNVAGLDKPPIAHKRFAEAVFGIWLGEKPVQEDLRKNLVSRAGELLR
jgi:hypothetical protein